MLKDRACKEKNQVSISSYFFLQHYPSFKDLLNCVMPVLGTPLCAERGPHLSFLFEVIVSGYIPFLPCKDPSLLEFLNAQHCCKHLLPPTEYISFSSAERHFIIQEWKERMSCHWKEWKMVCCLLPVLQTLRLEHQQLGLSCIYHSFMPSSKNTEKLWVWNNLICLKTWY